MSFREIVERATETADWASFGPAAEVYLEGLEQLSASIARDDTLTRLGRDLAGADISNAIANCLQAEKEMQRFPEARHVPMERPMFIVGFGRTGSTLIHNLIGLDPLARAPLLWELWRPSPPPKPDTYDSDPRIQSVREELDGLRKWIPELDRIHPMSAQSPDECHWIMPIGPHQFLRYRAPDYWSWMRTLPNAKRRVLYENFKAQAQLLQLHCRNDHWVGKTFVHQYFYPVMFDVFPDARVVRLHRDPCECVPSLASLFAATRKLFYANRTDAAELGRFMVDLFIDGSLNSIEADQTYGEDHFCDVLYTDLVSDPIATIRSIYGYFGYEYTDEFERRMRAYIANDDHRSGKGARSGGSHKYTPKQFDLTPELIRSEVEEYLAWIEEKCPRANFS